MFCLGTASNKMAHTSYLPRLERQEAFRVAAIAFRYGQILIYVRRTDDGWEQKKLNKELPRVPPNSFLCYGTGFPALSQLEGH